MSLIKYIRNTFIRSEYSRNLLRFGSGTVVSSLIPVIGTLFLMKIYTPDEYGALAVFVSSYFILSVISTGRYEYAIVLPKSEEKAKNLTILSILISLFFCASVLIVTWPFQEEVTSFFNLDGIGSLIFLIPLTAFLFAAIQSLFQYTNRQKKYGLMATAKIANNLAQVLSQIALGLLHLPFNGLIVGRLIGRFVGASMYLRQIVELSNHALRSKLIELKSVAKEYQHFPKHLSFSFGLSAFYQQLPTLFVTAHFAPAIAGQLAIATQLVAVPNAFVATAIGDVFRQRAAEDFREHGSFRKVLVKTMRSTFALALVPFTLIVLFAPLAFEWYDPTWSTAGEYASIIAVSFFFSFFITPIDKSLLIVEKTNWMLLWHLGFFIGHAIIIGLTVALDLTMIQYLYLLVVTRVLATVFIATLSYIVSGGLEKN